MTDAQRIVEKIKELYPQLNDGGIGVKAYPMAEKWLISFTREGHEVTFFLPGDFVGSCVDQGYCYDFREDCTLALGRLLDMSKHPGVSATEVVKKIKHLVPEMAVPEISIVVSQDDPTWSFFLTRKGTSRPVEYRLPKEVIDCCLEHDDCSELARASRTGLECLLGE
jgi:hypothetical protein